MSFWRKVRDAVLVVVLLAVPFFFLRASIRRPEELHPIDVALLRISGPVREYAGALARGSSSLIADYFYLVDVKASNDRLSAENSRLRQRVDALSRLETENRQLRRLLDLEETVQADTVSASVVSKWTLEYFRVAHVTLDKPNAAVKEDMPVLAGDGAVGTVLRVAGEYVDVQLAVDSGFGVDVVVERTGARGFVRGVGDPERYALRVEYVQRTDEVHVGDLIVTSGVGCRFPKGIPVGRVNRVDKREFGMYQTVEADPAVDFSRIEHVIIVLSDTADCEGAAGRKPRAKRP